MPPSLIKKLGLEFPRARVFKRYSKVPPPPVLNKGTRIVQENENEDYEEVKTGKGHTLSEVFIPQDTANEQNSNDEERKDSDKARENFVETFSNIFKNPQMYDR